MTTITWHAPFDTTRQMQPASLLEASLSYLVARKMRQPSARITNGPTSEGLTDDEVAKTKNVADALRFEFSDTPAVSGQSMTSFSQETQESWETERKVLELAETGQSGVLQGAALEPEVLDWEMVSETKVREKGTLLVSLRYAGRGRPAPDEDPWA